MPKAAKQKASTPATVSPKLKTGAVKPGATPKSLSALFVQLNSGHDAIEIEIQVNATMGVANPVTAPISCLFISIYLGLIALRIFVDLGVVVFCEVFGCFGEEFTNH